VSSDVKLEIAIRNFVDHCQAIPTALGSPGTRTPYFAANQHTLDIPYPNGITIGGVENSQSHIVQIQQLMAARPPNAKTGVVDAYPNLDLTPLGFEMMFDSPWAYREPTEPNPPPQIDRPIETVRTPEQLLKFDRAAAIGFGQPHADTVYSNPLLNDDRYRFCFIRQSGEVVAGVQTFTNEESVGIYTLFTLADHQRKGYAAALVYEALARAPGLPAITNPNDNSDRVFESNGFTRIGTRTIWIHP
jgi:GNAT superfamily N-acetyltransferase